MAILVTGGLGFVGSTLVDWLVEECGETDVVVIDNLCSESSHRHYMRSDVTYHIEDIRNLEVIEFEQTFDVVYHLAALARIQPSFVNPLKYFDIDALGTAKVLDLARKHKAKVVYAGSSSAYGGPFLNPYAFAKYTGEQVCQMYSEVYGLSTAIARFFNVYGPRQPTHGGYATVVGIFERQKQNDEKLTVTGDGTQRRDFTHVDDIVRGLVMLSKGRHSADIYQFGTGVNWSINELADLFDGEIEYIPARPGEADITLADLDETKERLGWSPYFDLESYVSSFLESDTSHLRWRRFVRKEARNSA